MSNLEVICYMDIATNSIQPFIQEKDGNKNARLFIQHFKTIMNELEFTEEEKMQMERAVTTGYYIDLLKKGHQYEELATLLQQTFSKQYDRSRSSQSLDYIMMEKAALNQAYQEYSKDMNCYGLSDFMSDTAYYRPKNRNMQGNTLEKKLKKY